MINENCDEIGAQSNHNATTVENEECRIGEKGRSHDEYKCKGKPHRWKRKSRKDGEKSAIPRISQEKGGRSVFPLWRVVCTRP